MVIMHARRLGNFATRNHYLPGSLPVLLQSNLDGEHRLHLNQISLKTDAALQSWIHNGRREFDNVGVSLGTVRG